MTPTFAIAGTLTREYLLPPNNGSPRLDVPGGNLLYAAGGLAVWDSSIALISKVNTTYPHDWVNDLIKRGLDVRGIYTDPESNAADLRSFTAYVDVNERSATNPVSHFARREMTFPKSLLGYQPRDETVKDLRATDPLAPTARHVPKEYRNITHIHLCPFDFTSQSQMVNLFKGGSSHVISLDPAPGYMKPAFWRELRVVLRGVMAFLPSEDEIRSLFWGETNDLWEMAKRICDHGPQIIVIKRGAFGQFVYDAAAKRRYEIPAYPARLIDPTGAGDAFCGGFLAGYQRTGDPLQAVLYGSVSASLKIEGIGAFAPLDAMPGLAEARLHALKEMAREV
ncbi:MAG: carbohydrate kinase family protein [Chloroflexi bacterium]|nr:carbohydrate kinase family protein [Chloroflexota bacterium]